MKIIQNTLLISGLAFALSGCATVINGTSKQYVVKTNPAGANVAFSNGVACTSPCKLQLKRRHDVRADIAHPGYKPTYVLIQSRTGGAAVGNLLLGGLIGGVIDGANGASNHLVPGPLNVVLAAEGSADEAQLLDKKGKVVSTVAAHNDKVRADVTKTIGNVAAGMPEAPVAPAEPLAPATDAAAAAPIDTAHTSVSTTLVHPASASAAE
ncbi:MAG: hypothetical protein V4579_05760 [Pseudomonadota bacterium]